MFAKKQNETADRIEKSFTVKEITAIITVSRESGVDEITAGNLHIKFQPKAAITSANKATQSTHHVAGVDPLKPFQDLQEILTDPSAFEKSALGE